MCVFVKMCTFYHKIIPVLLPETKKVWYTCIKNHINFCLLELFGVVVRSKLLLCMDHGIFVCSVSVAMIIELCCVYREPLHMLL